MIVCVAGNPSIDRLFEVEQLAAGEIHWPSSCVVLPGGKGLHVVQVAAALGSRAVATGILAGHAGRWIAETLAADGVEGRFAWGPGESRSCLSVADRATGSLTEFYEAGTPAGAEQWSELAEVVDALLVAGREPDGPGAPEDRVRWLVLAGSLPPGMPTDSYAQLIARARAAGVPVAVDSRGRWLAEAVAAGPELVKVNAYEAGEFLARAIENLDAAANAAAEIRARAGSDGHAVVVTMGEAGMVLVDPGGQVWAGSAAARGAYPVGSGDAFLAGLLVGLIDDEPWPRATALALGAGAANAEMPGAGRLDAARARALASTAEITPR